MSADLHARLARLGDESAVEHHPFCGAHPVLDDGPCRCAHGELAAVVRALTELHHPRSSRSIDTLDCSEHDVTKLPWRNRGVDHDACPDCVVTPITVCSDTTCEGYPCPTILAVVEALGVKCDSRP